MNDFKYTLQSEHTPAVTSCYQVHALNAVHTYLSAALL